MQFKKAALQKAEPLRMPDLSGRSGRFRGIRLAVAFCAFAVVHHNNYKAPRQYQTYQQAAKAQNAKANGYKNNNEKGHCQNSSVLAECGRISRACRSCTAGSRCAAGRIGTSGILLCRELHHRAHLLKMMGSLYSAALILSSSEI